MGILTPTSKVWGKLNDATFVKDLAQCPALRRFMYMEKAKIPHMNT